MKITSNQKVQRRQFISITNLAKLENFKKKSFKKSVECRKSDIVRPNNEKVETKFYMFFVSAKNVAPF